MSQTPTKLRVRNLKSRHLNWILDMDLNSHQITAFKGMSGCGKTTALNLLGLLSPVDDTSDGTRIEYIKSGKCHDLLNLSRKGQLEARRRAAFVFQDHHLVLGASARANIMSACEVANQIGDDGKLQDLWDQFKLPAGRIDQPVSNFSGGEQQRIAIIRALIREPDILFMDEPTASLDEETARQVMDLVKDWIEKRHKPTIGIWITHQEELHKRIAKHTISFSNSSISVPLDTTNAAVEPSAEPHLKSPVHADTGPTVTPETEEDSHGAPVKAKRVRKKSLAAIGESISACTDVISRLPGGVIFLIGIAMAFAVTWLPPDLHPEKWQKSSMTAIMIIAAFVTMSVWRPNKRTRWTVGLTLTGLVQTLCLTLILGFSGLQIASQQTFEAWIDEKLGSDQLNPTLITDRNCSPPPSVNADINLFGTASKSEKTNSDWAQASECVKALKTETAATIFFRARAHFTLKVPDDQSPVDSNNVVCSGNEKWHSKVNLSTISEPELAMINARQANLDEGPPLDLPKFDNKPDVIGQKGRFMATAILQSDMLTKLGVSEGAWICILGWNIEANQEFVPVRVAASVTSVSPFDLEKFDGYIADEFLSSAQNGWNKPTEGRPPKPELISIWHDRDMLHAGKLALMSVKNRYNLNVGAGFQQLIHSLEIVQETHSVYRRSFGYLATLGLLLIGLAALITFLTSVKAMATLRAFGADWRDLFGVFAQAQVRPFIIAGCLYAPFFWNGWLTPSVGSELRFASVDTIPTYADMAQFAIPLVAMTLGLGLMTLILSGIIMKTKDIYVLIRGVNND